ncbi:MAG: hypothetical protein H0Z37_01945 [Firmicutes bacterium]|nr:hypothetical protein [Bacillota bacterium]
MAFHRQSGLDTRSSKMPWWVPGADAGLVYLGKLQALSAIDPRVIQAMDFWLKDSVGDLGEARRIVLEATDSENYERWLEALKGYIGEQVAADLLETQGFSVEWAPAPNEQGWDLSINGQPVNVKVGATAEHVARHLAEHPDIPVVTSPELAAQFPDEADRIIALPELDNEALEAIRDESLDNLVEAGEWEAVFPVVTAVAAGGRELVLWLSGDTDLLSAVRNAGLDVAGVGVGMFITGHLAASALTALGVVNPLAATVASFGGGLLGKSLARSIKTRPLEEAVVEFREAQEAARREWMERRVLFRQTVLRGIAALERELRERLRRIERKHRRRLSTEKSRFERAVQEFLHDVPDRLESGAECALSGPPELGPWLERERQWVREVADGIRRLVQSLPPADAFAEVQDVLLNARVPIRQLMESVDTLVQEHARMLTAAGVERTLAEREARREIARTVSAIQQLILRESRKLHEWIDQRREKLKHLAEKVAQAARRLGFRWPLPE